AIEREERIKNVGMEKKKDENPKQNGNNENSENDRFIAVQNRRNVGFKEKVLRPNFKPNTQQPKYQQKKVNTHYEFHPKKNTSNHTASSEQVKNSNKVPKGQSPPKTQGKIIEIGTQNDKTPQKKAWSVHGEILSAMRMSTNKYFVLEVYDEIELSELQEMRNRGRVEGWNSNMNEVKVGKEVDDVFDDDSGIGDGMESDGMNGMDGDVLNDI
ncbi:hypothetical protein Tco_1171974, partial [Tanacetum coccineum]